MTKKELKLAGQLLEEASNLFSNHGCNDMPEGFYDELGEDEKEALEHRWNHWNSGGNVDDWVELERIGDDSMMLYFARQLQVTA